MSTAEVKSENRSNVEQNQEFQQQIEAYIAWVNSQLKKKPGHNPVKDLKTDFQDGNVLATLVEIISGEQLEGIISPACELHEQEHNVGVVIKYLRKQNIRMPHITVKDIVEGSVKCLMRLILTLAAHFKPASVGMRRTVSAAAAVNATVALGDLRRQVSNSGRSGRNFGSPTLSRRFRKDTLNSSPISSRSISSLQANSPDQNNSFSMSPTSCNLFLSPSPARSGRNNADISNSPSQRTRQCNKELLVCGDDPSNDLLKEYYEDLDEELTGARKLISVLQNLLLNGKMPEQDDSIDNEDCEELEATNLQEQQIILQSKVDLCRHEDEELKKELSKLRQEFRSSTASNSALRSRVQQQEKEMLALKQHSSKLNSENEKLIKERTSLNIQLDDCRKSKQSVLNDVAEKNVTIKQLKKESDFLSVQLKKLGNDSKDKLSCAQKLEVQVQDLSHQLHVLQRYNKSNRVTGDENSVIAESINSLRSSLPPHDSRQHIVDTLEQAIISISDQKERSRRKTEISRSRNNDFPSPTHSPRNRRKDTPQKSTSPSTTIIYFTDRNMTPVRAIIPKRIGVITLHDFKGIINKPEQYKYNFKALDPEFGTVKKEVFNDQDIVPGWEGKIVAWLEKENSKV